MLLFVFLLRKGHPLSASATEGMDRVPRKCVQVHTGGDGYHTSCVPTQLHTITLFMFLSWCLVLTFIKKGGASVRNGYFYPIRSVSVVVK